MHGEIEKEGGGAVVTTGSSVSADTVTDRIEMAERTDSVESLLVEIDSAGGGLLPRVKIAREVDAFDGATVACVTGNCASGAYLVASACDRISSRENALVGSIGVRGSKYDFSELGQKLGIEYESFVTGEYKDAGTPLKQISDTDRNYFQSIFNQGFENMANFISDHRDLTPAEIRETETRLYYAEEAIEHGLIDNTGDRDAAEEYLSTRLSVEEVDIDQPGVDGSNFVPFSAVRAGMRSMGRVIAEELMKGN